MRERKLRVAHIVPSLDIGGVEVGVARSLPRLQESFDYRVYFVRRRGRLECGQASVPALLRDVSRGAFRPDVAITSLWWSHPVGFALRGMGARWLAFFHNTKFFHPVDQASLCWAWRHADACAVDSEATRAVMARSHARDAAVVPYLFPAGDGGTKPWLERDIDIAWVGRNHPSKRLDLLCALLERLAVTRPHARVTVALAGGPCEQLARLARTSTLRITILDDADNARVLELLANARFYVLLSDAEGMSMSTVEAVQAGCLAMVRPVGEIPRYLDESGGLLVHDVSAAGMAQAAERIDRLWLDEARAQVMIAHARARLATLPSYVDALTHTLQQTRSPS